MMSRLKALLPLAALSLFISIVSCDVIDEPFKGPPSPTDTTNLADVASISQTQTTVFVEDFTGHRCKNCPKAGKVMKTLDSLYGEQFVGLAVHAGPESFTGVTEDYPTDFTTEAGDDILQFFNIFALPLGMVQRMDFPNTQKTYTAWVSLSGTELANNPQILLDLDSDYDAVSGAAVLRYKVKPQVSLNNGLKVAVFIKESHIVAPQLMPDNTRNANYVHNNVLRAAPLGSFGQDLTTDACGSGDVFSDMVLTGTSEDWDPSECEWVVIVYDPSNYRILQSGEIALS